METFEFKDGTKVQFEKFIPNRYHHTSVAAPSFRGKKDLWADLYLNEVDWMKFSRYRSYDEKDKDTKVYVGILMRNTKHGYPKGVYVPFKMDRATRAYTMIVDDLVNEKFIYNPEYMSKDQIAKIEGTSKETEEEEVPEQPVAEELATEAVVETPAA